VSDHERVSAESNGAASVQAHEDRKPYRKPSFRYEQVFETMALQCGKMAGTSGACNMVKLAS
jgi:hypothetical protein